MKKLSLFLAGVMLFSFCLTFTGCSSVKKVKTTEKINDTSNVTVKSKDGSISLKVPKYWNTKDSLLTDGAEIGVSDRAEQEYVEVKRTSKDDDKYANIEEYISSLKVGFSSVMKDPVISDESKGNIGGCDAVAVEVTGSYKSLDLVYYVYVIDGADYYYEVFGWTTQSKADRNKSAIVNVIKTFRTADKPGSNA